LVKYLVGEHFKIHRIENPEVNQHERANGNFGLSGALPEIMPGRVGDHQKPCQPKIPDIEKHEISEVNTVHLLAARKRHDEVDFQYFGYD
jgi:hypothetical protein